MFEVFCVMFKIFVFNEEAICYELSLRGNLYMFIISIAYMDLSGPLAYWYTGTSGG